MITEADVAEANAFSNSPEKCGEYCKTILERARSGIFERAALTSDDKFASLLDGTSESFSLLVKQEESDTSHQFSRNISLWLIYLEAANKLNKLCTHDLIAMIYFFENVPPGELILILWRYLIFIQNKPQRVLRYIENYRLHRQEAQIATKNGLSVLYSLQQEKWQVSVASNIEEKGAGSDYVSSQEVFMNGKKRESFTTTVQDMKNQEDLLARYEEYLSVYLAASVRILKNPIFNDGPPTKLIEEIRTDAILNSPLGLAGGSVNLIQEVLENEWEVWCSDFQKNPDVDSLVATEEPQVERESEISSASSSSSFLGSTDTKTKPLRHTSSNNTVSRTWSDWFATRFEQISANDIAETGLAICVVGVAIYIARRKLFKKTKT
eukprot:g1007.t1